jgi:16S rRNA (uracil1498-N3)-methyltransferase
MHLFYCPEFSLHQVVSLDADESFHLVRALRLSNGSEAWITDGKGRAARAVVLSANVKNTLLQVVEMLPMANALPYRLHIAISPLKNASRLEWFTEKATELGVHEITPIICSRTEKKTVNLTRLNKIVLAAMKQSFQFYLPCVHSAEVLEDFLHRAATDEIKLVCQKEAGRPVQQVVEKERKYTVLIGPEGDFTRQELDLAVRAGFSAVHLGLSRLRTETAGLYICALLRSMPN